MFPIIFKTILPRQSSKQLFNRSRSVINGHFRNKSYRVVVAGGGSGGISVAHKFNNLSKGQLAIIEPNETHYYQPLWTLVGGGLKSLSDSAKPMSNMIPSNADWLHDHVAKFEPESNSITLGDGSKITYDFLVVSLGIALDFEKIRGLPGALNTPGVCSNYSSKTVEKTWSDLQQFKGGNAIFTFPNTPIKCAGAPQKIMYLAEDYFRKVGIREKSNILFNTSLGVIFAVPKYAATLEKCLIQKNIHVNYRHNLVEVDTQQRKAVFEHLDSKDEFEFDYDFLHITPPQKPHPVLAPLGDASGFVDVDKYTLQHVRYSNVFALGDCSNLPTSRTAAAVAGECGVLHKNLQLVMNKQDAKYKYDGYTSCPLVTGQSRCVLAEFDYDLKPKETLPIDQSKERRLSYILKKDAIPFIYWNFMMKGKWNGPGFFRRLLRFGLSD